MGRLAYPSVYHAALWTNALATDLGTLGGLYSGANAINNAGQVVGWANTAGNVQHAALWNDTTVVDLNRFLDVSTVDAGWVLVAANDINDKGLIVWRCNKQPNTPVPRVCADSRSGTRSLRNVHRRPWVDSQRCFTRSQRAACAKPWHFPVDRCDLLPTVAISMQRKAEPIAFLDLLPIALIHRNWVCSKPDVSLMKKTCPTQAI